MKKMRNSRRTSISSTIVALVQARDDLRMIQREIGRVNSKTQIGHLMKNRTNILSRIAELEALLAKRIPKPEPLDLRIFQAIHRALGMYGHGVSESVLNKFEFESELQPLEIVNQPEAFCRCIEKVFGKRSSHDIVNSIVFEICNEFGLQLSSRSNLADAIRIARASMPILEYGEALRESTTYRSRQ